MPAPPQRVGRPLRSFVGLAATALSALAACVQIKAPSGFSSPDPSPEQRTVDADIGARIHKALGTLSPQQKLVFTLRHYQGYKLKEIATMMKCTEGTVKRYLFAATQRMRGQLHDVFER